MSSATIQQIATQAGVSRATAARALSGSRVYERPTFARRAEHIRQLATRMGYRPNAAAKAVSTGRFHHVGLIMGTHPERSNFTRELLRGVHDALQQRQTYLSIWFLDDDQLDDQTQLPAFLEQRMVDGLLINYTHGFPQHMCEAIDRTRLPVIWVNTRREEACIYPNDVNAGRQAVEYLRGLGHERIAFADFTHGPDNTFASHYSVLDRRAGYQSAMRESGLEPCWIEVSKRLSGRPAVAAATAALEAEPRVTAVVCQALRDLTIAEAAATKMGLDVPEDLSLITFGSDRSIGSLTDPTVLVEPREAMGRAAARALLERISHPDWPSAAQAVPFHLNAQDTTAPRPDR